MEAAISQAVIGDKKLFTVVLRDITERKQAEQALKDSAERYQRLLELIPEPLWIEHEGRITFANLACLQLLGAASAQSVVGSSPLQFIPPKLHVLAAAGREPPATGGRMNRLVEKTVVRLDGELRDVEVAETAFHEEGRLVIVTVLRSCISCKRLQSGAANRPADRAPSNDCFEWR